MEPTEYSEDIKETNEIDNTFLSLKQGISSDIRIKTFVRFFEEDNLNLRPNYQRNEVINRTKASRVLESAILGIPLPPIYLFKDNEGRFEVIDGQQRLISFLGFLGILKKTKLGKFTLSGLEILSNLNGRNTDSDEFKIFLNEKIRDFTLRTITFEEEKGFLSELKYEIFERLNKDPYPIKANCFELWNCIYLSDYTRMIRRIAKNNDFLNVVSRKSNPIKDIRMDNENDILRYLVLLKHYDKIKDRVEIPKNLILEEIKERFEKKTSIDECEIIETDFLNTIKSIKIIFPDRNTLGNVANNAEKNKYPNLTLLDVLLVIFHNEDHKFLLKYKDEIFNEFKMFYSDSINRAFIQNAKSGNNKATTPLNDRVDFLKRETIDKIKAKYQAGDSNKRIKIRDLDLEQRLLYKQQYKCPYCNNLIKPADDIHIDHMQSIFSSGSNDERNLAIVHKLCNLEKGKKSFRNWKDLISIGETSALEFKSSLRWDYQKSQVNKELGKVVAKTIVSFLNTEGGILLIGVDDKGVVLGLENDILSLSDRKNNDGFLQMLTNIINNFIGPQFHNCLKVYFEIVDEKELCVVEVDKSNFPAYLNIDSKEEFYIRANTSSVPMSTSESVQYINSHFNQIK